MTIFQMVSSRDALLATLRGIASNRWIFALFGAMLLSGVISSVNAPVPFVAFLTTLAPLILFFFVTYGRFGIVRPADYIRTLILGGGALGLIVIIAKLLRLELWIGDFAVLGEFGRRGNVLGMANNGLAAMMEAAVVGGLGMALLFDRQRLLYAAAGMSAFFGILITFSRGSIVGITGASLLLLIFAARRLRRYWKHVLVIILLIGVVLAFWPSAWNRIVTIADLSYHKVRVSIWKGTLDMIAAYPIFGSGPGNFGETYQHFRLPEEWEHAVSPHNHYLYVLSGWGIVGGIIYFGFLARMAILPLMRRPNVWRQIAFAMMAAYWIHSLVDDLIVPHVLVIMGCIANPGLDAPPVRSDSEL